MDTPNNTKDAEGLEIVAVWLDKDGLIEPAAMLRRLATALRAPVAQPVSVPAAYISHNVLTAKDHFDRVPLTSLQPGVYKHTPLYLKPDADFERLRSILASEIECLIFEQHVLPALAVAEKALSDHTVPTVVDAAPIGYLPAYELERLNSGHDAILRSAKFGPSALDGDVPVFAVPSLTNHERIELYELREGAEPASVAQDAAGEPVARTAPFNNCQFRHCDLPGQCRAEGKCHHPVPGAWRGRGTAPAIPVADPLSKLFLEGGMYKTWLSETGEIMREHIPGTEMYVQKDAQRTDAEGLMDHAGPLLLNILWHHQGASSRIGQAVRALLGMGQHDHLSDVQVDEAKRVESILAARPASAKPVLSGDERIAKLEKALVYVAHSMHSEPQHMLAEGITLGDVSYVRVKVGDLDVSVQIPEAVARAMYASAHLTTEQKRVERSGIFEGAQGDGRES